MAIERQVSFAGGELAPTLWGRTDLDRYPIGARTLRNFLVTPHGVLVNRPGTVLVPGPWLDRVLSGDALPADAIRLVRFVISVDESALLVFTSREGGGLLGRLTVLERDALTGEFVFAADMGLLADTPDDVRAMRFAQVGDVMTVVTAGQAVRELRRSSTGTYAFGPVSFAVVPFPTSPGSVRLLKATATPAFAGDASHPARVWQWAVTRVMRRTSTLSSASSDGTLYETMPQLVTEVYDTGHPGHPDPVPGSVAIYPDWAQTLKLDANAIAPVATEDTLVTTRFYRGREGTFGYVGETTATAEWVDDGQTPDFSKQPPKGTNPFQVYDATGALVRTDNPSDVTFFEGRRYFVAGGFVRGSAVDDFSNFDEIVLATEADALSFRLSSKGREEIQAMVPKRQLLLLTNTAEWLVSGSGLGELITPLSIAAHPITQHGSNALAPAEASNTLFHMLHKGVTPHAMVFGPDGASYQSVDVGLMARHLFDKHTVVGWAYAQDPYSILWVVRDDGKLLSLTYVQEQQVAAWAQHDIAGDAAIEAIETLPYGNEDVVYIVARRGTARTLERLSSRQITDVRRAIFLDQAVTNDGYASAAQAMQTLVVSDDYSTGGTVGADVLLTFSGGASINNVVQVDDPDGGQPVRFVLKEEVTAPGLQLKATVLDRDVPAALFGATVSEFALCSNTVHGLDHLEGTTVTALVDGAVVEGLVVSAGAVTLGDTFDDYAAIVQVGRPYTSDFRSLAAANSRDKQKIVKRVILETDETGGGLIGPSLSKLTEVLTRDVADSYGVPTMKRREHPITIADQWKLSGYIAYRQAAPLPVTILGLSRDVEYGG